MNLNFILIQFCVGPTEAHGKLRNIFVDTHEVSAFLRSFRLVNRNVKRGENLRQLLQQRPRLICKRNVIKLFPIEMTSNKLKTALMCA